MKPRRINDQYDLIVPDHVADWDAPSNWERERIEDTIKRLTPADTLLDVGAEHGWISALYAKEIGCEMMLAEPCADFWRNIKLCWDHNGLAPPVLALEAFIGDKREIKDGWWREGWPTSADNGLERGARPYPSLVNPPRWTAKVRIDDLPLIPSAITIDVEGAELLVLQGAERTLKYERPIVWCSIHPDMLIDDYATRPTEVLDFMTDMGYKSHLLAVDHEEHFRFDPVP